MTSIFSNVFSNEDIEYLTQLPEVIDAKSKMHPTSNSSVVYFKISLTETIRTSLLTKLGLDCSNVSEIPMRWVKGDMETHVDIGSDDFTKTYLVYINNNPGEFIIDNTSYNITANTGFVFDEGLEHKTINTGTVPRLLLGPINEFAKEVGAPYSILYYDNYADAYAMSGNYIAGGYSFVIGTSILYGSIGTYTSWRVAAGDYLPTGLYNNGFDLSTFGSSTYYLYPSTPCFLEGTNVLCQVDGIDKYIPIETISKETLVKTSRDGYKKVEFIGKGNIENPGNDERIENRLYKCSPSNYHELTEDLYITGCHSILVDKLTEEQSEKTIQQLGELFVTDGKFRLISCIDERAEPWNSEGGYTIWHIALENKDVKMNYGIFVNGGLLVETCSINFLQNRSNMTII